MTDGIVSWHSQCKLCSYEAASFGPEINVTERHSLLDEVAREDGLKSLRERNFRDLIDLVSQHLPERRNTLLDVGAAHGWFVRIASERFEAVGIEPDHAVCQRAKDQGIDLIEGYFPDVLTEEARFRVIVFNDVFEHIPDPRKTLDACRVHLSEGGLLVLNLPSADGFFYRSSKLLARIGFSAAFERMWQMGFPSPHLHYFGSENLLKLVERHGFEKVCTASLPSIRLRGLYARISYVGEGERWRNALTLAAAALMLPFLAFFKSDIMVLIVKKAP